MPPPSSTPEVTITTKITTTKRKIEITARRDLSPPATKRKVVSTTTSATVANFFKPASAKESEKTTWRAVEKSLVIAKYVPTNYSETTSLDNTEPRRIAGFDLDSTLIKTLSGKTHAASESDWRWWDATVPNKLKELYTQGYTIIIFTNQGGLKIEKPATRLDKFKIKVAAILSTLDLPVTLYGATENDRFRKPRTGMWHELVEDYDLDVHGTDKGNSFLVGDAAGRHGDHSAVDRHFAENVGIKFYTPEEFFLGLPPSSMKSSFNPIVLVAEDAVACSTPVSFERKEDVELVILVGSPGAGKTSFVLRHLIPLGYERVNQDILKSRDKCVKVASEHLKRKQSVAIDNTNADVDTRAIWVALAKSYSVPIRCIHLTASSDLCQHNDAARALGGSIMNPENRKMLPKIAFTGYASRYKQPRVNEGFLDITTVAFRWEGDNAEKEIWTKHWI